MNRRWTAEQKFKILQEAETSGNTKNVCLMYRISASQFYTWKKKFKAGGIKGLQRKHFWVTHNPLPDFVIPDGDWIIQGLKRASSLPEKPLSDLYKFDLRVQNRWVLRRFTYDKAANRVLGFHVREAKGFLGIVEPLGEVREALTTGILNELILKGY